MKISEILPAAARELADKGVPEPIREASSLLRFALNRDRVFLISHPDYELSAEEQARFEEVLRRRVAREPLQYITGVQEFYGLDFAVTPAVLIPRPETEMLVAESIKLLGHGATNFAEIGVGSGCISISVLANLPDAHGVAADISAAAIEIATTNAKRHAVSSRLELIGSDLFDSFGERSFDLIVSNPPYIPVGDLDGLQPEVREFEPKTALTDGRDGLSIIRRIVETSPRYLREGGHLVMEIGFTQAERVASMFESSVWASVDMLPDFQGIPRTVVARLQGAKEPDMRAASC